MVDQSGAMQRYNALVMGAATLLFAASAYNVLRSIGASSSAGWSLLAADEKASGKPEPKTSTQSSVARMTYTARPEDCQTSLSTNGERPKIHAGALLKLIDIAAGVAARRHSGMPCVTISVDSVVLLKPIFQGDLIHVSASVNRAWGSSMEVGVRIVKESLGYSDDVQYVSHSYLTFVAINKATQKGDARSANGIRARLSRMLFGTTEKPATKVTLSPITPTSRLESRRHFLAGRRRTKRLEDAKQGKTREGVSIDVKKRIRAEVETMLRQYDQRQASSVPIDAADARRKSELLRSIEMEVVIQAWAQGDKAVTAQDGTVEVNMPGDEPIRFPESEVRSRAKRLGVRVPGDARFSPTEYRLTGFATPTWANGGSVTPSHESTPSRQKQSRLRHDVRLDSPSQLHHMDVADTLTTSMQIVFPQHTNSHGLIFGGNTMSWSEDVALLACRKIRVSDRHSSITWKTVAMDGLEFNVQVVVGDLMVLSAIVIQTYAHSCEVYVLAQAEDRQGRRRITNDVLFTLAYDVDDNNNEQEERSRGHITSQIVMPTGSALETFAAASHARRLERLELRQMLVRVYGE